MQAQISVEVWKESMRTILISLFFVKVHEREPMRLSRFLTSSCYFYAAFVSSAFFNFYHQPLNLLFVKRLTGAIKNISDGKWMVWSVFCIVTLLILANALHITAAQGGRCYHHLCKDSSVFCFPCCYKFHVVVFGQPECQGSNPLVTFDHACIFVWNGTTPQTVSCLGFVLLISPLGVGMLLSSLPSCLYRILAKQAMGMAAVSRPTPKTSCLRAWLLVISLR